MNLWVGNGSLEETNVWLVFQVIVLTEVRQDT